MTPAQTIEAIRSAASTPFGVLDPAKVVAETMREITELRSVHKLKWVEITKLFNEAMRQAEGRTVTSGTLTRLYHLERQRQLLREIAGNRNTAAVVAAAPAQELGTAPTMPTGRHAPVPSARARDPPVSAPSDVQRASTPSAQNTMQIVHEMNSFKMKMKKDK